MKAPSLDTAAYHWLKGWFKDHVHLVDELAQRANAYRRESFGEHAWMVEAEKLREEWADDDRMGRVIDGQLEDLRIVFQRGQVASIKILPSLSLGGGAPGSLDPWRGSFSYMQDAHALEPWILKPLIEHLEGIMRPADGFLKSKVILATMSLRNMRQEVREIILPPAWDSVIGVDADGRRIKCFLGYLVTFSDAISPRVESVINNYHCHYVLLEDVE